MGKVAGGSCNRHLNALICHGETVYGTIGEKWIVTSKAFMMV
jgi:hypothetical protein